MVLAIEPRALACRLLLLVDMAGRLSGRLLVGEYPLVCQANSVNFLVSITGSAVTMSSLPWPCKPPRWCTALPNSPRPQAFWQRTTIPLGRLRSACIGVAGSIALHLTLAVAHPALICKLLLVFSIFKSGDCIGAHPCNGGS